MNKFEIENIDFGSAVVYPEVQIYAEDLNVRVRFVNGDWVVVEVYDHAEDTTHYSGDILGRNALMKIRALCDDATGFRY